MWDFTQKIEPIIVGGTGKLLITCDFLCIGNGIARKYVDNGLLCGRWAKKIHFTAIRSHMSKAKPDSS
jgi:hypothetical protein